MEIEACLEQRRGEIRPGDASRRAWASQRNDAPLHAGRRDDRAGAARRRQQARLGRPQSIALQRMEMDGDAAPDRRTELHSAARRFVVGRPSQLSGRGEDGASKNDGDGRLQAAADFSQRRRHELRGPRLAQRAIVDELLLVTRGKNVDLSGQDQGAFGGGENRYATAAAGG